nr:DUF4872 domain-containing protein [Acrocarpospora corrugata]
MSMRSSTSRRKEPVILSQCCAWPSSRGHRIYTEAATLWTEVAGLITQAGDTGDAAHLTQASTTLHDLSRIDHDAMQALTRVQT